MKTKSLRELGDNLFAKRATLMSLWQEIAEQMYVERADFTVTRTIGEDFAAHLTTSYPLLCRRDLGDQVGVMLRPTNKPWFHMKPRDIRITDNSSLRWLEEAENTQRRMMYDRDAQFARAAKEADHDFATFGQAVISVELNRTRTALLYRNWHLRDVAWRENQDGKIDFVARKWRVAIGDLIAIFPRGNISPKLIRRAAKNPFEEIIVMHIVCATELWDGEARSRPRVSIFYDCEHDLTIEEVPIWQKHYVIPRWQTVSGSQYAFSPATVAALPEARLLQAMALTLLEASEKATNPPLIAQANVVKSDMQQFPGGVTWVDAEYDEKMGEALRALNIDIKGLPISLDIMRDSRSVLSQCFFLNKLRAFNPGSDPTMTAFQAGQIVQEYIRGALPLFEPMEMEYNGAICDETFDIGYRNGAFGPPSALPKELRNAHMDFHFESPLHDAIEQMKGAKFMEFSQLVATAIQLDPACAHLPDAKVILRDVADGVRVPAKWLRSELSVQEAEQAAAKANQEQQMMATLQQGSEVAKNIGAARKDSALAVQAGQ